MSKFTKDKTGLNDPVEPAETVKPAELDKPEQKRLVEQLGQVALSMSDDGEAETATLEKPKKRARLPRMLKELGGHNKEAAAASQDQSSTDLLEGMHGTRSTRQGLRMAVDNTAQQGRKSLNERYLMQQELRGARSGQQKTKKQVKNKVKKAKEPNSELDFGSSGDTPSEASPVPSGNDKDFAPSDQTQYLEPSPPTRTTRKTAKNMQEIEMDTTSDSSRPEKLSWDEKKDITTWILSQGPYKSDADIRDPNTAAYFNQIFPGFNFSVSDGVPVFAPSLTVFNYFSSFLLKVEQWFGHQTGVIKIIIPEGWATYTPASDALEATDAVSAHSTDISENEGSGRLDGVFDITPHHPQSTSVATFLEAINEDYRTIGREWKSDEEDIWKANHLASIVTEQAVLTSDCWPRREEKLFAQNVPGETATSLPLQNYRLILGPTGTETLRIQLGCDNPRFNNLGGNSLQESFTRKIGVHSPVFDLSGAAGTLFGMQIAEVGAYKVAYVLDGAPRVWTVVRPYEFQKVEALIPSTRECHQSVGHKELSDEGEEIPGATKYVPSKTLSDNGIEHTKFAQFDGEMVILFPFAYHQGYNVGPNIVETMAYASERWKVFPVANLIKQCTRGCFKGRPPKPVDLGFAKPSLVGSGGRSLSAEEATQQILSQYLAQFGTLQ
ncbi:MAG: hypothetical protein Q9191_007164 [Dirinaria sp. TL-2023a]